MEATVAPSALVVGLCKQLLARHHTHIALSMAFGRMFVKDRDSGIVRVLANLFCIRAKTSMSKLGIINCLKV